MHCRPQTSLDEDLFSRLVQLDGLRTRARLREERDALDDLAVSTGGGAERLATVLRRTQYREGACTNNVASVQYSGGRSVENIDWLRTNL